MLASPLHTEPAGHGAQAEAAEVCPVTLPKLPGEQLEAQPMALLFAPATLPKRPAGQGRHADEEVSPELVEKRPAAHAWMLVVLTQ